MDDDADDTDTRQLLNLIDGESAWRVVGFCAMFSTMFDVSEFEGGVDEPLEVGATLTQDAASSPVSAAAPASPSGAATVDDALSPSKVSLCRESTVM